MLDKGNTGTTHRGRGYACAQACAKEGFQVGLVTGEGKVYHVSGGLAAKKNAKLVPHMGHVVTVTGEVTQKDNTTVISSDDLQMVRAASQER
jgi:NAD(P)-dependent dehydrogenase (short-subunit alcohol dehydrogenase family)